MVTTVSKMFKKLYGGNPMLVRAPGRINLIGEHTDYNDGFVLPAAINRQAVFALALNNRKGYRFFAADLNAEYKTNTLEKAPEGYEWANYLLGAVAQFEKEGVSVAGVDCVFSSDIPLGAGLSSSAAIECGIAWGLNELLSTGFSSFRLAKMAQSAEHDYAGVMCGIMDQFASIFGKKDHVFRLDCRSLEHSYYQLNTNDVSFVLVDTQVKHKLASSAYNERRLQCNSGVGFLQTVQPGIRALRDVTPGMLENHKSEMDEVVYKRCHYVVNENRRVEEACVAIAENKIEKLGELMYQTHAGLRHDYQVSCDELDLLVDLTHEMDYVYGARMMGGGFGGCTINLLESSEINRFANEIRDKYKIAKGVELPVYFVSLEEGVSGI